VRAHPQPLTSRAHAPLLVYSGDRGQAGGVPPREARPWTPQGLQEQEDARCPGSRRRHRRCVRRRRARRGASQEETGPPQKGPFHLRPSPSPLSLAPPRPAVVVARAETCTNTKLTHWARQNPEPGVEPPAKRPRGRPPKNPKPEKPVSAPLPSTSAAENGDGDEGDESETPAGPSLEADAHRRKRGRPRKNT
jgi:hypothetical protein